MRRRSLFGPLLLVLAGTTLLASNLVPSWSLGAAFAEHWPWLLVLWGGAHLLEQALSPSFGWRRPRPLGGGAVVLALLVAIAGTAARQARSADFGFVRTWDQNWFHEEKHSFDVELTASAQPEGLRLNGLRGEIEIRGVEENEGISVSGKMLLSGVNLEAAERRTESAMPELVEADGWVTLGARDRVGSSPGREYRLTILVPQGTRMETRNAAGRLTVQNLQAGLTVEGRGSVSAHAIGGPVEIVLEHGKRVEVRGASSLSLKGSAEQLDVRGISGSVEVDGNLYRDAYLEDLKGSLKFLSRSIRLEAERALGSVEIKRNRLTVRGAEAMQLEVKGSQRIEVLEPIGATSAFLERGRLIVEPGPESGEMKIRGLRADVEARIRQDIAVSIETEAKRGSVRTFIDEMEEGAIPATGPTLRLESEGGDIEIRPAAPGGVSEKL